jgi:hypothetical protein
MIGLVAGYGAPYAVVDMTGVKIGFELRVDRLRKMLIEPGIEFLQFCWRKSSDCLFDFQKRMQAHCIP